jgi:hypothetical protein
VKLCVSAVVGVPLITPVLVFNERPAGKVPEKILQLSGAVPPVATSV